MKKYELTSETRIVMGRTLHRIKALTAFGDVGAGELGGFVEKEDNLSHYDDARVSGGARVSGDAQVSGIGTIFWIGAIGSRNDTTTFFMCKDRKIRVTCGCFFGTIEEFSKKVAQAHGNNQYAKVYMPAIEMAKERISIPEDVSDEASP